MGTIRAIPRGVGRHGRLARMREEKWRRIHVLLRWHRRDRGCVGIRPRLRRHGPGGGPIEPGALSASGIVAFDLLAERLAAARRTNPGLHPGRR